MRSVSELLRSVLCGPDGRPVIGSESDKRAIASAIFAVGEMEKAQVTHKEAIDRAKADIDELAGLLRRTWREALDVTVVETKTVNNLRDNTNAVLERLTGEPLHIASDDFEE